MGVKWGSISVIYCKPLPPNITLLQINVDLGAMLEPYIMSFLGCSKKLLLNHVYVVLELCVAKILESSQFFWGAFMSWTQGSKKT
jgi:hypothetical protein